MGVGKGPQGAGKSVPLAMGIHFGKAFRGSTGPGSLEGCVDLKAF